MHGPTCYTSPVEGVHPCERRTTSVTALPTTFYRLAKSKRLTPDRAKIMLVDYRRILDFVSMQFQDQSPVLACPDCC